MLAVCDSERTWVGGGGDRAASGAGEKRAGVEYEAPTRRPGDGGRGLAPCGTPVPVVAGCSLRALPPLRNRQGKGLTFQGNSQNYLGRYW